MIENYRSLFKIYYVRYKSTLDLTINLFLIKIIKFKIRDSLFIHIMQKLFKKSSNLVLNQAKKITTAQHKTFASYLIKNGTVVNADRQFKADVVIEGDKI